MTTIAGLGLVLLILMVLVGRKQGWTAFLSLFLNLGFLYFTIILVASHVPPSFVTITIGIAILAITIFVGEDDLWTTMTTFYASLIVLCLILVLVFIVEHWAMVQSSETKDGGELEGMSILIGISYFKVSVTTTILNSLGATAGATMAISSGLAEILKNHPERTNRQLTHNGMAAGQQIIGTTFNAPFFGFFGGLLVLFIWFLGLHYSLGTIMSNKASMVRMIEILLFFVGVLIIVPMTAWVMTKCRKPAVDNHSKTE